MKQNKYNLKKDHQQFCKILIEAQKLRWRKLCDYNATYRKFGILGIIIRMSDKMARMEHLLDNKTIRVSNESMRDTAIDLINYSAMLILLLDEQWSKRRGNGG